MQYFGGKARIAKNLAQFLESELKPGQTFIDLFCGSCNVVSKIPDTYTRIANDKHRYLMAMWEYVQRGGYLPDNISEEEYKHIKDNREEYEDWLVGFVGFGLSYSGKWWGGYCRDNNGRNYCVNAKNSILKKINLMEDVIFTNKDYTTFEIPTDSLIYCDIPYKNTTKYCKKEVGVFSHDDFYEWAVKTEDEGTPVYISEYADGAPEDATVVWSKHSKKDIRNSDGVLQPTEEVVFRFL